MMNYNNGQPHGTEHSIELWANRSGRRGEPIVHGVFYHDTFMGGFTKDLACARGLVLLQSPYVTIGRLERLSGVIKSCVDRGIRICVFLRQPREWSNRTASYHPPATVAKLEQLETTIKLLKSSGVHVNLRPGIHEKLVVIDDNIFWEGSLNPLSHYDTTERINRWVSRNMVTAATRKHNLDSCDQCSVPGEFEFFSDQPCERDAESLGKCIASRRKLIRLSQFELASRLGLHQSDISEIESGKRNIPLSKFSELCKLVGLRVVVVPGFFVPAIKRLVLPRPTPPENDRPR